ncbi:hypothetical protein V6N13_040730 [Hibiscus sabdariffa]|uniref:Uncharacterized protein n=1 Tax=Hibiscus sabdariffa TaxID=183260 RepID=A0ABR2R996_9ROSI
MSGRPTSILKLSLPSCSFKSNVTKLPISLTTTNSSSTKLSPPRPWRRILSERSFGGTREVPTTGSGPDFPKPPLGPPPTGPEVVPVPPPPSRKPPPEVDPPSPPSTPPDIPPPPAVPPEIPTPGIPPDVPPPPKGPTFVF